MPKTRYREYTDEFLQAGLDAYYRVGENYRKLSEELKCVRSTAQYVVQRARQRGLTPRAIPSSSDNSALNAIIEGLRSELDRTRLERDEAHASLRIATKPHFTIRQDNVARLSKVRVVCIGDAHDSPALPDKSRFRWIGNYIRSVKPDLVIQIGDFGTFDSLNSHAPNDTLDGRLKPPFEADLGSFNIALGEMGNLDGIEKHETMGNHERRLYLYENAHPEMQGRLGCSLESILKEHGWTYSPYGMPYMVGGVAFVHACLNTLGKTYGGKTAENTIANDAIHDWVIGHSHRDRKHRAAKLGGHNFVQIVNVGCALPQGHIEDYATHTLTGWSYGIADMVISGGHVRDYNFISMDRLSEDHG